MDCPRAATTLLQPNPDLRASIDRNLIFDRRYKNALVLHALRRAPRSTRALVWSDLALPVFHPGRVVGRRLRRSSRRQSVSSSGGWEQRLTSCCQISCVPPKSIRTDTHTHTYHTRQSKQQANAVLNFARRAPSAARWRGRRLIEIRRPPQSAPRPQQGPKPAAAAVAAALSAPPRPPLARARMGLAKTTARWRPALWRGRTSRWARRRSCWPLRRAGVTTGPS